MLQKWQRVILFFLSWVIVAWGSPAMVPFFGVLAAAFGYALFWSVTVQEESAKKRFWLATVWLMGVQMVQLDWLIAHPYWYILTVYVALSAFFGVQFGFLSAWITKERLQKKFVLFGLSGAWVFFEWSRLFILSGYSLNPAGMALASHGLSMQLAAVGGVFGLSFYVLLTNLFALRAWMIRSKQAFGLWLCLAATPYLFGWTHQQVHSRIQEGSPQENASVVLVQTAFPIEETIPFRSWQEAVQFVMSEWQSIFTHLTPHLDQSVDLIVLPEYVVPYGTYYPVFRYVEVVQMLKEAMGEKYLDRIPELHPSLAMEVEIEGELIWMVNNAFFAQTIANLFDANVVIGLEDEEACPDGGSSCYSAAFTFYPQREPEDFFVQRYEKRVLVPMGEYIPCEFLKDLCKSYGITGSFTPGAGAKVHPTCIGPISPSVCYEETFGDLMREGRVIGAEILVNLTNDGWYPHSNLPFQHLEHARLRTVEMGVPLLRSCNTGVTCAIDSFGQTIALLQNEKGDVEEVAGALAVQVPRYHYSTLYGLFGDRLILGISLLSLFTAIFCTRLGSGTKKRS